ncbi:hypothetical protein C2S51_023142 [Perilla frutescens var. frutescens]|nr:hypothetical protein C2S51_023142 [Perilla frutescens var. frutescens]
MAALLSRPPRPAEDFHSGLAFRNGFHRPMSSVMREIEVGGGDTVHVAVGKSVEKTAALLLWTFSMFPGQEICLIHVHRPSPLIPTLLGKLPASRASPEIVAAFRNEEREETTKLLSTYLMTCSRSRVKASIIISEADEIQKGILNLVNLHFIRKLVVGAIPDFMKGKKSSCKACRVSKQAPPYCKMWFVNKGKLIWTRQAPASLSIHPPSCQLATSLADNFRSCSLNSVQNEAECVKNSFDTLHSHSISSSTSLSSCTGSATLTEPRESSTLSAKFEEERLCIQVAKLHGEVDVSRDEANLELLEQKKVEVEALEVITKVKALESAHSHEVKLRMDAEDALRITIQEQEKLFEERQRITQELQKTMRNIAVLDSRAHEANCRREEVAEELKLIQASIATLQKERQRLQRQNIEATRWLHRWRSHEQCEDANQNEFIGLVDVYEVPEFSLWDLEAATCCFSENFSIGRGGYGTVYKGEILDKTIAVKKLHFYNMQRQLEFHREVLCPGRLRHPHLVELIGVCRESWLLVYEYLPGGSLREHLFDNNIHALTWKIRAQFVADIASGLLFLHSRPKKIIHGNLKPENILLDSQNRCKISDYVDHMLTAGQAVRCPSFRGGSGSSGVCLYTDPECHRTGALTNKSDIYSFGVITLQLVTGKTHGGLVGEVRRAVLRGKVASILDVSAGEWSTYVARRLVELGLQCCELNGRDRPELTPLLVKELQCMPFLEEQTVPSFFLCPILREIMHDPQVAADGFTYEGEAIREWLGNEHDSSPMTNAKLSDLNLTPNYSLKLVIQDWIANLKITC